MDWKERSDLDSATQELVDEGTVASLNQALENYEKLINSDPNDYQLSSYKLGAERARLKIYSLDHEANHETQSVLSWLDDEDMEPLSYDADEEDSWQQVDLNLVMNQLLSKK